MFELRFERDGYQVEAARTKGRKPPEWFTQQPHLQPGDDFWIAAFFDLNTTRNFEGGPIPWSRIREYGIYVGLDADLIRTLIAVIRAMDVRFLGWREEQRKRQV